MAPIPGVTATLPTDHLTSEIQQLLGPSFANSQSEIILPDYIRSLPPWMQREDIEYLAMKGALTIPDVGLRNELLKA